MTGGHPRRRHSRVPRVRPPDCLECSKEATQTTSQKIYPRRPDLWNRPMWICACGAYVGCHDGTILPKGRPAGKATRAARMEAHSWFDPMWLAKQKRDGCSRSKARKAGYKWLAEQLGVSERQCHIGEMDAATALRVVEVCRAVRGR